MSRLPIARFKIIVFILLTVTCLSSYAQETVDVSLKDFFNNLYQKHISEYQKLRGHEYDEFCYKYGIDEEQEQNGDIYFKLYFFHELFTGQGASDYSRGGMLRVPYFWHWIKPNPRHEIIRLPDKTVLTEIQPPDKFSRYKSFADVDRVPSLFLVDLVSESPNYFHPNCGEFYTFGWCSEREMTFCLLLSLYGFQGKIRHEGIHVWSSFWISLIDKEGKDLSLIADIDNTFDIFSWSLTPKIKKEKWFGEHNNDELLKWYNSKAMAKDEIDAVMQIKIGNRAMKRIDDQVSEYLQEQAK